MPRLGLNRYPICTLSLADSLSAHSLSIGFQARWERGQSLASNLQLPAPTLFTIRLFWNTKLRHRVIGFIRFETTYLPYLQEQRFPLDLEDEDISVPRISGTDYTVTRRHMTEERYLQLHRCENLNTHTFTLNQKVNCLSIACCHERYLSLFFGPFAKLRKATISFVMSVRLSAWNNSAPTGRFFVKFYI